MGLGLVFDIFDLEGVGIPLGLGPIPVAVWAVDEGLLTDLGMWNYPSCMGDSHYIIIHDIIVITSSQAATVQVVNHKIYVFPW